MNLNDIKGISENNYDLEKLDIKHNAKKLLSLNRVNIINNNNNLNKISNDNILSTNFAPDSPSNKVFSMKILTFGNNCNFPNENINEIENEDNLGIINNSDQNHNRIQNMHEGLRVIKTEFNSDLIGIDLRNKMSINYKMKDIENQRKKSNRKSIICGEDL